MPPMDGCLIAVTGGIACGKSTLARFLAEAGCAVLDTDDVAHALQASGGLAVAPIAGEFGAGVLAPDGSIDRGKLGKIVFADPSALARLNAIVHPMVGCEVARWIAARGDGVCKAVLVPLLYETGLDRKFGWDATVAVVCRPEEQLRRLMGRGLRRDEALARISSQMPCAEKARRSDYVVENDGGIAQLRGKTLEILRKVSLRKNGE